MTRWLLSTSDIHVDITNSGILKVQMPKMAVIITGAVITKLHISKNGCQPNRSFSQMSGHLNKPPV